MRLILAKVLLWVVCISHLVIGFAGTCAPARGAEIARMLYGAHVEATPAVIHLMRILGAFMIAMGLVAAIAATDPRKYRPLVVAITVLLAIRVAQRIVHADEIQLVFGITGLRLWLQSAFFASLAGLLLFLPPKKAPSS